ncbi:MAG: hypothetical protein SVY10_13915 [Thermodesulfobacteriota bacterium]|nr:hypothetical protein [Thermodesulfobacteriota bacterium]
MIIGTKANRLKARKYRIIIENVPDAPATIPPKTKAIKVWCAIESRGKRKMPEEPQTTPEKTKLTKDRISQRAVVSDVCNERSYCKKSRHLKSDTDTIAKNQMMSLEWGMTFHSIKQRMSEFTRVATIPIGVSL